MSSTHNLPPNVVVLSDPEDHEFDVKVKSDPQFIIDKCSRSGLTVPIDNNISSSGLTVVDQSLEETKRRLLGLTLGTEDISNPEIKPEGKQVLRPRTKKAKSLVSEQRMQTNKQFDCELIEAVETQKIIEGEDVFVTEFQLIIAACRNEFICLSVYKELICISKEINKLHKIISNSKDSTGCLTDIALSKKELLKYYSSQSTDYYIDIKFFLLIDIKFKEKDIQKSGLNEDEIIQLESLGLITP